VKVNKPTRVLVVEDNPEYAELARLMLSESTHQYEVETVDCVSVATERLKTGTFEVILLDTMLPDSQGINTILKVHTECPTVPIVVLTGTNDKEMENHAVQVGAQDYLIKGNITSQLLIRTIRYAIERKRVERVLQEANKKIKFLHQAALRLEICQSENKVYQIALKATEEIFPFSTCSLDIVEEDRLVIRAALPQLPLKMSQDTNLDGEGLAAKTYRAGKIITFGNLNDIPEVSLTDPELKSGISIPISNIGVFQVASTKPSAFTEEDVELFGLLVGYITQAVKRIRLQNELKKQATCDSLTGLYNRHHLNLILDQEIKRSKRYRHAITFLMIDVNNFKKINDCFGHQAGDKVLQLVASVLLKSAREADIVVRYGGDEFLIVLIETHGGAGVVKRRIVRNMARSNKIKELLDFSVTLSIGSAAWSTDHSESLKEVLARADRQMYEEKGKQTTNYPSK